MTIALLDEKLALATLGADRELLGRSLIAAHATQIGLNDVVCNKLSSIPALRLTLTAACECRLKSAFAPPIGAKLSQPQVSMRLRNFQEDTEWH